MPRLLRWRRSAAPKGECGLELAGDEDGEGGGIVGALDRIARGLRTGMTSEVMVLMTSRLHIRGMKKILPLLVLLPFAGYSTLVILEHGYFGFLTLALREPWAMQLLLDLSIACFFIGAWIRRDARDRGISALPYLLLLPFLGSIATLAYFVHRAWKGETTPAARASSGESKSRLASA